MRKVNEMVESLHHDAKFRMVERLQKDKGAYKKLLKELLV